MDFSKYISYLKGLDLQLIPTMYSMSKWNFVFPKAWRNTVSTILMEMLFRWYVHSCFPIFL